MIDSLRQRPDWIGRLLIMQTKEKYLPKIFVNFNVIGWMHEQDYSKLSSISKMYVYRGMSASKLS